MLARLLRSVEALFRRNTRPHPPSQIKQVLVLEYRLPLGCCVHLTPIFRAIRQSRPDVKLILATRSLGLQLNRHSPDIDYLIETPDPLTDLPSAVSTLRGRLRALNLQPDYVLTGASDPRTRISLLALLAGSGRRIGFTLKPSLYHEPLVYDPAISLIDNNLKLAQALGCLSARPAPTVCFSPGDAATATQLLREANPLGKPVAIVVTQNSGGQSTGWHTDGWAAVIQAASARGCNIVYVGTAADRAPIQSIIAASANIGTSIAGQTTVTQLAAVLALSDIVITLDTGTMHVGRAAGVPMVVLGPSWQKPIEWLPLGIPNVRILRGPDRDDVPPNYRLDEISQDSVIAAIDDLLAAYPPSEADRARRTQASLSAVDHLSALPAHPAT